VTSLTFSAFPRPYHQWGMPSPHNSPFGASVHPYVIPLDLPLHVSKLCRKNRVECITNHRAFSSWCACDCVHNGVGRLGKQKPRIFINSDLTLELHRCITNWMMQMIKLQVKPVDSVLLQQWEITMKIRICFNLKSFSYVIVILSDELKSMFTVLVAPLIVLFIWYYKCTWYAWIFAG